MERLWLQRHSQRTRQWGADAWDERDGCVSGEQTLGMKGMDARKQENLLIHHKKQGCSKM